MDQTYFRVLHSLNLKRPITVVGLPGIGRIGNIVARFLIESSRAELFAEMYSPSFPDYVVIDKNGICRPPRYEFYASTTNKNLLILTGDAQLPIDNVVVHHEICGEVIDFISDIGSDFIITVDGASSPQPTKDVYIAATSKKLAAEYSKRNAALFKGGRIIGPSGLLLGLAKMRRLRGICIIGQTTGLTVDQEAALNVYRFIKKIAIN
ncbi:MAG: PAC2 family protein [Candidatus Bathyarchaeia archaeon]